MKFNFFIPFVFMNKTVRFILEAIKLVITAALGYFGGNAVM